MEEEVSNDTDALLGVVGFPVEPPDGAPDALAAQAYRDETDVRDETVRDTLFTGVFDETLARNEQALAEIQDRLVRLRAVVKNTYAEIKELVEEELFLRRMVAVGRKRRR